MSETDLPLVSIVITGRNEEDVIYNCLKSIIDQTYPNFEIIFVDDKSTDKTYEIVSKLEDYSKSFKNCKRYLILSEEANSPAKGRNFGVKAAKGPIIAFTDADCVAHKDWLVHLVRNIPKEYGAVGGPNILRHSKSSRILYAIDKVLGTQLGSGGAPQFLKIDKTSEVYGIPACNFAIQKELFVNLGGFNENLRYNEDTELCYRIREKGYKIIYVPDAKVDHFMGIDSLESFTNLIHKYALERGKNSRRNHKLLTKYHILSLAFISIFFSLIAVSFLNVIFLNMLVILTSIAVLIPVFISLKISIENKNPLLFFIAIPIFLWEYLVYNVGFIAGFLFYRAVSR